MKYYKVAQIITVNKKDEPKSNGSSFGYWVLVIPLRYIVRKNTAHGRLLRLLLRWWRGQWALSARRDSCRCFLPADIGKDDDQYQQYSRRYGE